MSVRVSRVQRTSANTQRSKAQITNALFKCFNGHVHTSQMFKCLIAQMLHCYCSNARMLNFSNAQMIRTNAHMFLNPLTQMLKCSNAQMLKCSHVKCTQMHKCSNAHMSNAQMLKLLKCTRSYSRFKQKSMKNMDERSLRLASKISAADLQPVKKALNFTFGAPSALRGASADGQEDLLATEQLSCGYRDRQTGGCRSTLELWICMGWVCWGLCNFPPLGLTPLFTILRDNLPPLS